VFSLSAARSAGVASRLGLTAALMAVCTACGSAPTEAECNELLARYTELLVVQEQRRPSPREIERAKLRAQDLAARDERYPLAECPNIRRSQLQCAMQAPDVDAMETCLTL
jgi:hypothetical protein